jgi:hypothetical protein
VIAVAAPVHHVIAGGVADLLAQGLAGDAVAEDVHRHPALRHHLVVEEPEELLPLEPHGERARARRLGEDQEHPQRLVGTRRRRRPGRGRTRRLHPHHQIAFEESALAGRGARDLPGHPGERRREAILQSRRLPDQERPVMDPRMLRRQDLGTDDRLPQEDADLGEELRRRRRPVGEAHAVRVGPDEPPRVKQPLPQSRLVLGEAHLVGAELAPLLIHQAETNDARVGSVPTSRENTGPGISVGMAWGWSFRLYRRERPLTRRGGTRDNSSMSKAAQRLIDEFESLPESDQKVVAAEILRRVGGGLEDSLDDLTDEQREVIDLRLAEHAQNPDSAIPWEEGRARLFRRFA